MNSMLFPTYALVKKEIVVSSLYIVEKSSYAHKMKVTWDCHIWVLVSGNFFFEEMRIGRKSPQE